MLMILIQITYLFICIIEAKLEQYVIAQKRTVVPQNIDDLQSLPGVGRKTANVIASVIYDAPTIAVDTHVFRVAARIGLVHNAKTPLETEKQLMKHTPQEYIPRMHHWLILHGRYICTARNPKCTECGIREVCDFYKFKS